MVLIAAIVTLSISMVFGIIISELIISRLYPQNTYKIAQTGVASVFKKSQLLPFELKKNANSYHIAPTHEFANDLTTNSLGYRGPEFTQKKDESTIRILMLGDSTTFGIGSNDGQTFPVILEELLRAESGRSIEVINAGFASGLSPDTYYLYLKEIGYKFAPDIVFVNLFLANDITDLFENDWVKVDDKGLPLKITSKERQIDSRGRLVFRQKDWKYRLPVIRDMHVGILALNLIEQKLPQIEKIIRLLVNAPDLLAKIPQEEQINCLYHNRCTDRFEKVWQEFALVMTGFSHLQEARGIPIIITLMPAPFQLTAHQEGIEVDNKIEVPIPTGEKTNLNYPQKRIMQFLPSVNLGSFDLLKAVRDGPNPEYSNEYVYPDDGHFTPKGNAEIAKAYFKYLTTKTNLVNE